MFHDQRSILDLPFEIMVEIINKLPYADVHSVRLTCSAFNDAGMYVQKHKMKRALHKMKRLADSAHERCRKCRIVNERFVRSPTGNDWQSFCQVKCLADIIRVADASTYHFLLDGSLPPVPCALLSYLEEALSIATERNSLVGGDRFKRIFVSFDRYLTTAMNSLQSPLKMTSVFRSVMNLLVRLIVCVVFKNRYRERSNDHKPYGLQCRMYLRNTHTIILSRNKYHLTAPLLIRFLARLNVKEIEKAYRGEFQIRMGNLFGEEDHQTVDAKIYRIDLDIYCRPEQSVVVRSLEQIFRLEPTDFDVRLYGVTSVRRPNQSNSSNIRLYWWDWWERGTPLTLGEGEQLAFYIFASSLPPLLI